MSRPNTKGYFVKERLVEARDARSMTQRQLAKKLGVSDRTISHWECGERTPEPNALDHIADALDLYPSFFLKKNIAHGDSPIFFRSLSNATVRARTRERAKVRWLQHISVTLQEHLDFPDLDMPVALDSGQYKTVNENDLEDLALTMRRHWGLGEGPIKQMVLVAENAGIVIGVGEVGSSKIDGQGTWSAFDGRPYILLARDKDTAFRRQMDASHELAHIVLHKHVTEDQLVADFELIEYQAKYLACALLLPARSFTSEILSLSLDGFLALKRRWMVSIGAMIMRANQLDLLSDEGAKLLWKYRATRGWHRREPLDPSSETPVEEPRLLRRSIEMIVDAKFRDKRVLLEQDFGLGAVDVETLAALPSGYFAENGGQVVRFEPQLRKKESVDAGADIVPFRRSV